MYLSGDTAGTSKYLFTVPVPSCLLPGRVHAKSEASDAKDAESEASDAKGGRGRDLTASFNTLYYSFNTLPILFYYCFNTVLIHS